MLVWIEAMERKRHVIYCKYLESGEEKDDYKVLIIDIKLVDEVFFDGACFLEYNRKANYIQSSTK